MIDFGEILRHVGELGLFQKLLLLGLSFPNMILSLNYGSLLFVESDPERHCNTDWILGAGPNLTEEEQLHLTVPREPDGSFSRCLMYAPVDWTLDSIRRYGLNHTTACRDGWVYDQTLYQATIVTDFDLVCDQANQEKIAQTVLMSGYLLGSLLFGYFAESIGRKRAIQIPTVLLMTFIVAAGFCPNYYLYIVTQFMSGVGMGGYRVNSIVLVTEWMGTAKRSLGLCVCQIFKSLGSMALAGIMYLIRDWRQAQLAIASPMALALIYIWFIPESAQWLLKQGKAEEVKKLILKAAAINKQTVPESLLDKISEKTIEEKGVMDLLIQSCILKYFVIITFIWFSINLAYLCVVFNISNLGLNIFLTQFMFGLSEMPAHILCIWLLEIRGRKVSLMATALLGGFFSFLVVMVPRDQALLVGVLVITGQFFLIWGMSICNIYIQELFPTSIRHTATGLSTLVVRLAGLLSPLLNLLAVYHWTIPIIVFSTLALGGGALTFMLPETRVVDPPDPLDQMEAMDQEGKQKSDDGSGEKTKT
ncbi:unnamed protein product [Arctogadus glacialis]